MPPQSHSQSNNEEPSTSEFSQDLSENTRKAYATDWALYTRWCRMQGTPPLAATPDHIARYLTEISAASGLSSASVRRRLAGLVWNYHQRGFRLDRNSPLIAAALSEISTNKPRAAVTKDAITPQEIRAMVATLPFDLRGLRDRAILLMGYIGGLGRSDLIGLDLHQNDTEGGTGWIDQIKDRLAYSPDRLRKYRFNMPSLYTLPMDTFCQDPLRACVCADVERWQACIEHALERPTYPSSCKKHDPQSRHSRRTAGERTPRTLLRPFIEKRSIRLC